MVQEKGSNISVRAPDHAQFSEGTKKMHMDSSLDNWGSKTIVSEVFYK
jgi:hypothetical protein